MGAGRGRAQGARVADEAAGLAARLRHDLGKYVRLSAPAGIEADTERLRERLEVDVTATRKGPGGAESAADVFRGWLRDGGEALEKRPAFAAPIARIRRAVEEGEELSRTLATLSREELERLDAVTRTIAEECRRLAAAASGDRS
jgi:hypothetical protein